MAADRLADNMVSLAGWGFANPWEMHARETDATIKSINKRNKTKR